MKKCKKALNFDLDTKLLKESYPGKHYFNAYRDIKHFLENNGFLWRQGSGYISSQRLTDVEVRGVVVDLSEKFDWLKRCVKQFDVTDVGHQYSLLGPIGGGKGIDEPTSPQQEVKSSLDELITSANQKRDEQNINRSNFRDIENVR